MDQARGAFSFESYRINNFSFSEPDNEDQAINISFNPRGAFYNHDSTFMLEFDFISSGQDDGKQIIRVKMMAIFTFKEKIAYNEIPDYFFRNAIAIVFPYIRSFVSTLTLLSGTKHLLLPVLNLSSLERTLKENIEQVNLEFGEFEGGERFNIE